MQSFVDKGYSEMFGHMPGDFLIDISIHLKIREHTREYFVFAQEPQAQSPTEPGSRALASDEKMMKLMTEMSCVLGERAGM